jgi:hypothetical protein
VTDDVGGIRVGSKSARLDCCVPVSSRLDRQGNAWYWHAATCEHSRERLTPAEERLYLDRIAVIQREIRARMDVEREQVAQYRAALQESVKAHPAKGRMGNAVRTWLSHPKDHGCETCQHVEAWLDGDDDRRGFHG